MSADSQVVFQARVAALGLEAFNAKFVELGWGTLGEFAFSVNFTPGPADPAVFAEKVVAPLTGQGNHQKTAALRRLFFEAYTTVAAETQRKLATDPTDARPAPLANLERADRMSKLKAKFSDLDFDEEWEPSWTLIGKFHTMFESGLLKYLPWSSYTRQDHEARGEKEVDAFQVSKDGFLKLTRAQAEGSVQVNTDLLLQQAFARRGAAMHIAKLLDFRIHAAFVKHLSKEYMRDPVPGYSKVTMEQVMAADREVFLMAAQRANGNLSIKPDGAFALDAIVPEVTKEYRISAILAQSKCEARATTQRKRSPVRNDQRGGGQPSKRAKKNSSKGVGKTNGNKSVPLPKELVELGCRAPADGRRFCFSYNMRQGCSKGKACGNGDHACLRCHKQGHSAASKVC